MAARTCAIHTQSRFGRLAQLLLLDARQHEHEQACRGGNHASGRIDPATCAALNDAHRTMLGAPREAWLAQRLGHGTRLWNVIGQPTLFGQRNFCSRDQPLCWSDGWDGYLAARQWWRQDLDRLSLRRIDHRSMG
ncbi:MAG: alkaline phosphatase D family protein [Burkholderiaceae bacterium]